VAYVDGEKYSVAHPSLRPDVAIVDPELTYRLPASLTVATGLDAFCQAVESMWAVGATEQSLVFAREAMQLAWKHLGPSANTPTPESRFAMSRASHLAGNAINISKTTSSHALSYFLTSHYGIPHGTAVAMTLSTMLAYNAEVVAEDCVDRRGPDYVRARIAEIIKAVGGNDIHEACRFIERWIASLNSPYSLKMAGITQEQAVREVVDSVDAVRMSNNPRATNSEILMRLLAGSDVDPHPINDLRHVATTPTLRN
jgi:alcohol dehydrogenase class IV